jgi:hypothetical protein
VRGGRSGRHVRLDALHPRRAQQLGQHPRQRARGLAVAERGEHEQAGVGDPVGEVAQDKKRWLGAVMDVVEDDEQGVACSHPSDGVGHVLEEPEAVRGRRRRTREHRFGIHVEGPENLTP